MQLDEVPAMAASNGGFDFGAEPTEETFDHLHFSELLRHKNWKARKVAYELITANHAAADRDAFLDSVEGLGAKDAASPALDSFLEAVASIIEADEGSLPAIASPAVIGLLVEKGLVGRPRAATASAKILASCIGCGEGERVSAALFAGINAKAPKARIAVIQCLTQSVLDFGVQWINVKQLLGNLKPLFNDTDAKVRKETQNLCVACYRFIGDAVMRNLSDLRDVQQQELAKLFAQVKCDAVAIRRTSAAGAAPRMSQQPSSGRSSSQGVTASLAAMDPFSDVPEQQVLHRLPPNFLEFTRDRNAKWTERVDYINDHLLKALSVPRLATDADYSDIVKGIRDFINDLQLPISNAGFKCLQALTKGLRHGLAPYVRFLIPTLFDKFKEKKAAALEATSTSLSMLVQYGCCTYDHFQDELDVAANSKLPNHRHAALQWALQAMSTDPDPSANFGRLCRASAMIKRAIGDEKVEVREAGMALLAKIIEVCGPSSMRDVVASLDDKQRARLGLGTTSTAVAPMNASALTRPAAAAPAQAARPRQAGAPAVLAPAATNSVVTGTIRKPPTNSGAAGTRSGVNSEASTPTASSASPWGIDEGSLSGVVLTADAAKSILESCLPAELHEAIRGLGDSAWRARADAAAAIEGAVQALPPRVVTELCPALIVCLKAATGGKESLFQAVNASASMCLASVAISEAVPTRTAMGIIQQFAAKLTEPKSRAIVRELLSTLTEHVGPRFLLRAMCGMMEELGNPKFTVEALDWIEMALQEFPSAPVDAKAFVEFIRGRVFEQPAPAARAAGVKALATLRVRVGPKLDGLVNGINPHLKQSFDDAVVGFTPLPVPVRALRPCATASDVGVTVGQRGGAAKAMPGAAAGSNVVADLPPSDLSHILNAASQNMVSAKDWRDRANAVKCIEEAVNAAAKNIAGNGVSDALKALRTRLEEPNKNFVVDVLRVMNLLMESAPAPSVRAGARVIFPVTINMLGDMKQQLRDEAIRSCNLSLMSVGLEPLLGPFVKAFATENQSARLALSELLVASMNAGHHTAFAPKGLAPLVQPLLRMLVDRYIEIRQRAETCFSFVLSNVGLESVHRAMSAFKPMDQKLMAPILERIRPIDAMPAVPPRSVASVPIPNPAALNLPHMDEPQPPQWQAASAVPTARRQLSLAEITAALKNARDAAVPQICADLQNIVEADVMSVDARTIDALLCRARSLFLTGNGPQTEEAYAATRAVFSSVADLMLDAAFAGHLLAEDAAAIANTCFACIQCPAAAEPYSQDVLKTINGIMARLLQNGHPSVLVTVLVNMLLEHCERDMVEPMPYTKKCIDLTCKCIYKMTNFDHRFMPEVVIPLAATFLHRLPPSSFKSRDDTPIRSIKHLLKHLMTQHSVSDMLRMCERLVGQSSLVYSFVHMWQLRQAQEAEQQQAVASHVAARQQAEASPAAHHHVRHQDPNDSHTPYARQTALPRQSMMQRGPADLGAQHTTSAAPATEVDVVAMFQRARKHDTSAQGMRELFEYQLQNPKCHVFSEQYNRCTEAFKRYIDTMMVRFREGSA